MMQRITEAAHHVGLSATAELRVLIVELINQSILHIGMVLVCILFDNVCDVVFYYRMVRQHQLAQVTLKWQ